MSKTSSANGPITGQGTAAKEALLDLQLDTGSGGNNGVTFNSGANLVVNGTGTGGLRVQAKNAAAMANLLTSTRYTGITGSGGTLTLALTNNDSFTDSPARAPPLRWHWASTAMSAAARPMSCGQLPPASPTTPGLVLKGATVG